eukprot:CFRG0106T1
MMATKSAFVCLLQIAIAVAPLLVEGQMACTHRPDYSIVSGPGEGLKVKISIPEMKEYLMRLTLPSEPEFENVFGAQLYEEMGCGMRQAEHGCGLAALGGEGKFWNDYHKEYRISQTIRQQDNLNWTENDDLLQRYYLSEDAQAAWVWGWNTDNTDRLDKQRWWHSGCPELCVDMNPKWNNYTNRELFDMGLERPGRSDRSWKTTPRGTGLGVRQTNKQAYNLTWTGGTWGQGELHMSKDLSWEMDDTYPEQNILPFTTGEGSRLFTIVDTDGNELAASYMDAAAHQYLLNLPIYEPYDNVSIVDNDGKYEAWNDFTDSDSETKLKEDLEKTFDDYYLFTNDYFMFRFWTTSDRKLRFVPDGTTDFYIVPGGTQRPQQTGHIYSFDLWTRYQTHKFFNVQGALFRADSNTGFYNTIGWYEERKGLGCDFDVYKKLPVDSMSTKNLLLEPVKTSQNEHGLMALLDPADDNSQMHDMTFATQIRANSVGEMVFEPEKIGVVMRSSGEIVTDKVSIPKVTITIGNPKVKLQVTQSKIDGAEKINVASEQVRLHHVNNPSIYSIDGKNTAFPLWDTWAWITPMEAISRADFEGLNPVVNEALLSTIPGFNYTSWVINTDSPLYKNDPEVRFQLADLTVEYVSSTSIEDRESLFKLAAYTTEADNQTVIIWWGMDTEQNYDVVPTYSSMTLNNNATSGYFLYRPSMDEYDVLKCPRGATRGKGFAPYMETHHFVTEHTGDWYRAYEAAKADDGSLNMTTSATLTVTVEYESGHKTVSTFDDFLLDGKAKFLDNTVGIAVKRLGNSPFNVANLSNNTNFSDFVILRHGNFEGGHDDDYKWQMLTIDQANIKKTMTNGSLYNLCDGELGSELEFNPGVLREDPLAFPPFGNPSLLGSLLDDNGNSVLRARFVDDGEAIELYFSSSSDFAVHTYELSVTVPGFDYQVEQDNGHVAVFTVVPLNNGGANGILTLTNENAAGLSWGPFNASVECTIVSEQTENLSKTVELILEQDVVLHHGQQLVATTNFHEITTVIGGQVIGSGMTCKVIETTEAFRENGARVVTSSMTLSSIYVSLVVFQDQSMDHPVNFFSEPCTNVYATEGAADVAMQTTVEWASHKSGADSDVCVSLKWLEGNVTITTSRASSHQFTYTARCGHTEKIPYRFFFLEDGEKIDNCIRSGEAYLDGIGKKVQNPVDGNLHVVKDVAPMCQSIKGLDGKAGSATCNFAINHYSAPQGEVIWPNTHRECLITLYEKVGVCWVPISNYEIKEVAEDIQVNVAMTVKAVDYIGREREATTSTFNIFLDGKFNEIDACLRPENQCPANTRCVSYPGGQHQCVCSMATMVADEITGECTCPEGKVASPHKDFCMDKPECPDGFYFKTSYDVLKQKSNFCSPCSGYDPDLTPPYYLDPLCAECVDSVSHTDASVCVRRKKGYYVDRPISYIYDADTISVKVATASVLNVGPVKLPCADKFGDTCVQCTYDFCQERRADSIVMFPSQDWDTLGRHKEITDPENYPGIYSYEKLESLRLFARTRRYETDIVGKTVLDDDYIINTWNNWGGVGAQGLYLGMLNEAGSPEPILKRCDQWIGRGCAKCNPLENICLEWNYGYVEQNDQNDIDPFENGINPHFVDGLRLNKTGSYKCEELMLEKNYALMFDATTEVKRSTETQTFDIFYDFAFRMHEGCKSCRLSETMQITEDSYECTEWQCPFESQRLTRWVSEEIYDSWTNKDHINRFNIPMQNSLCGCNIEDGYSVIDYTENFLRPLRPESVNQSPIDGHIELQTGDFWSMRDQAMIGTRICRANLLRTVYHKSSVASKSGEHVPSINPLEGVAADAFKGELGLADIGDPIVRGVIHVPLDRCAKTGVIRNLTTATSDEKNPWWKVALPKEHNIYAVRVYTFPGEQNVDALNNVTITVADSTGAITHDCVDFAVFDAAKAAEQATAIAPANTFMHMSPCHTVFHDESYKSKLAPIEDKCSTAYAFNPHLKGFCWPRSGHTSLGNSPGSIVTIKQHNENRVSEDMEDFRITLCDVGIYADEDSFVLNSVGKTEPLNVPRKDNPTSTIMETIKDITKKIGDSTKKISDRASRTVTRKTNKSIYNAGASYSNTWNSDTTRPGFTANNFNSKSLSTTHETSLGAQCVPKRPKKPPQPRVLPSVDVELALLKGDVLEFETTITDAIEKVDATDRKRLLSKLQDINGAMLSYQMALNENFVILDGLEETHHRALFPRGGGSLSFAKRQLRRSSSANTLPFTYTRTQLLDTVHPRKGTNALTNTRSHTETGISSHSNSSSTDWAALENHRRTRSLSLPPTATGLLNDDSKIGSKTVTQKDCVQDRHLQNNTLISHSRSPPPTTPAHTYLHERTETNDPMSPTHNPRSSWSECVVQHDVLIEADDFRNCDNDGLCEGGDVRANTPIHKQKQSQGLMYSDVDGDARLNAGNKCTYKYLLSSDNTRDGVDEGIYKRAEICTLSQSTEPESVLKSDFIALSGTDMPANSANSNMPSADVTRITFPLASDSNILRDNTNTGAQEKSAHAQSNTFSQAITSDVVPLSEDMVAAGKDVNDDNERVVMSDTCASAAVSITSVANANVCVDVAVSESRGDSASTSSVCLITMKSESENEINRPCEDKEVTRKISSPIHMPYRSAPKPPQPYAKVKSNANATTTNAASKPNLNMDICTPNKRTIRTPAQRPKTPPPMLRRRLPSNMNILSKSECKIQSEATVGDENATVHCSLPVPTRPGSSKLSKQLRQAEIRMKMLELYARALVLKNVQLQLDKDTLLSQPQQYTEANGALVMNTVNGELATKTPFVHVDSRLESSRSNDSVEPLHSLADNTDAKGTVSLDGSDDAMYYSTTGNLNEHSNRQANTLDEYTRNNIDTSTFAASCIIESESGACDSSVLVSHSLVQTNTNTTTTRNTASPVEELSNAHDTSSTSTLKPIENVSMTCTHSLPDTATYRLPIERDVRDKMTELSESVAGNNASCDAVFFDAVNNSPSIELGIDSGMNVEKCDKGGDVDICEGDGRGTVNLRDGVDGGDVSEIAQYVDQDDILIKSMDTQRKNTSEHGNDPQTSTVSTAMNVLSERFKMFENVRSSRGVHENEGETNGKCVMNEHTDEEQTNVNAMGSVSERGSVTDGYVETINQYDNVSVGTGSIQWSVTNGSTRSHSDHNHTTTLNDTSTNGSAAIPPDMTTNINTNTYQPPSVYRNTYVPVSTRTHEHQFESIADSSIAADMSSYRVSVDDDEREHAIHDSRSGDVDMCESDDEEDTIMSSYLESKAIGLQQPASILRKGRNVKRKSVTFNPLTVWLDSALHGDVSTCLRMLESGFDVDTANEDGLTALHNACCGGHFQIAQLLLEHGADPNCRDVDGWTPLHGASAFEDEPVIECLLRYGAVVHVKNSDGETPLSLAEHENIKSILINHDVRKHDCVYARAAFDYKAKNPDELNLTVGELLEVNPELKEGPEWWWCKRYFAGDEGYACSQLLIPASESDMPYPKVNSTSRSRRSSNGKSDANSSSYVYSQPERNSKTEINTNKQKPGTSKICEENTIADAFNNSWEEQGGSEDETESECE